MSQATSAESFDSNSIYQALLASEVGAWMWDVRQNRILWTEQLERLFGLQPGTFSGTFEQYINLIHPDDREHLQATVNGAIQSRQHYEIEHRVVWPDGSVHWLLGRGRAFHSETGQLLKMTGTTIDITEKKIQEEALQKKTEELDRFAAVAAHDLKEPLNSITQFAKLLQEEHQNHFNAEAQQSLDFIVQAGRRMTGLIDSLLAFARAGEAHPAHSWKPVSLQIALQEAVKNLWVPIQNSKARISLPLALPTLPGQEMLLIQLFQNLIGNSIKYHTPGVTPEIAIEAQEQSTGYVISVHDNGIGISPQELPRIFNFFERLQTDQNRHGYGIGLAVCKKIVEIHGGRIWVDSKPLAGSMFSFFLPKTQLNH